MTKFSQLPFFYTSNWLKRLVVFWFPLLAFLQFSRVPCLCLMRWSERGQDYHVLCHFSQLHKIIISRWNLVSIFFRSASQRKLSKVLINISCTIATCECMIISPVYLNSCFIPSYFERLNDKRYNTTCRSLDRHSNAVLEFETQIFDELKHIGCRINI